MEKRYRYKKAKPGQVIAYYGKMPGDSPDVIFAWGGDGATKRHANVVQHILGAQQVELLFGDERKQQGREWKLGKSGLQMLEEAGFDLTTLKFSIELKKPLSENEKDSTAP